MPRIPLIEDLTQGPIPDGSNIMVQFDPSSQWYNAALTIAAGWLRSGGTLDYIVDRPPQNARLQLHKLGLDVKEFESDEKLKIIDRYTVTLGFESQEKYAFRSLKVQDRSIALARVMKGPTSGTPDSSSAGLEIGENASSLARLNEEKVWVDFVLTRFLPATRTLKGICLFGLLRGVHSDWAYSQLDAAVDGIIDFKLEERGGGIRNLMRIRTMRDVPYDSSWHPLKIDENFEVSLEK